MSRRSARRAALAFGLAGLVAGGPLACREPAHAGPDAGPAATPAVRPARHEVRATILRATLRVAESMPPLYFVDVVSALENGCVRFARADVRRDGKTIFVDVWNSRPAESAPIACTMIYGEKETAVALGSDFVAGERYTLDVNGERQAFVAQ